MPTAGASPSRTAAGAALEAGALDAGTYHTKVFEPTLEFTVGDGWNVFITDDVDELAMERAGSGFVNITRVTQVVDTVSRRAVDAPDDLVAWLSDHPAWEVEETEPVTIGGLSGPMLQVTVGADVEAFAYAEGNMRVIAGDRVRYYVLDLDGPDLTIVTGTAGDRFEDFLVELQPVLDSLEVVR